MKKDSEIILYKTPNQDIKVEILVENETIWLPQQKIAELFDTTKQNVSLHVKNIFKSGELDENSVVKDFLTTASDGKNYKTKHYNLDAIISIGYRVNSITATKFRQWATSILKNYIQNGYAINHHKITEQRLFELENDMRVIKSKIKDNSLEFIQNIFYDGQVFDAYSFINDLLKLAIDEIILIDNYIDDTVFTLFSKYPNINFTIYTSTISKQLKLDFEKYSKQYKNISLKTFKSSHDRFLIIDKKEIYHLGASLKDLGKKWFAFSKMSLNSLNLDDILHKLEV